MLFNLPMYLIPQCIERKVENLPEDGGKERRKGFAHLAKPREQEIAERKSSGRVQVYG
jgi:hypothetical protein